MTRFGSQPNSDIAYCITLFYNSLLFVPLTAEIYELIRKTGAKFPVRLPPVLRKLLWQIDHPTIVRLPQSLYPSEPAATGPQSSAQNPDLL